MGLSASPRMMTINNLNGGKRFAASQRIRPSALLAEAPESPCQNAEHHDNNANGTGNDNQGNFAAGTATPFGVDRDDAEQDEQQRADQHDHEGLSGRPEMQDDRGGDAGRNGNDCAPPP